MINTGACKSKQRLLKNLADIYHRHMNAWFREKANVNKHFSLNDQISHSPEEPTFRSLACRSTQ